MLCKFYGGSLDGEERDIPITDIGDCWHIPIRRDHYLSGITNGAASSLDEVSIPIETYVMRDIGDMHFERRNF